MKKAKALKENNKGFTLVELIVVILMMSLISGMLVIFVSTSLRSFSSVSTDVALQTEADYAVNYLNDKCMEANGIYVFTGETIKDDDGDDHEVTILACLSVSRELGEGTDVRRFYFAIYDAENKALRALSCLEDAFNPAGAIGACGDYFGQGGSIEEHIIGNRRLLLAECVSSFTIDTTDLDRYKYVKVEMGLSKDSYNYSINKLITERNQ